MDNLILNRIRGVAVGAAVGDALGMPLEFRQRLSISKFVTEMLPGRLPAGTFTDDTEMALAVAENLLTHHPLDPVDLSKRFVSWMNGNPPDIGIHTRTVLQRLAAGESWDNAAQRIQRNNPSSAGNGSVMRCWPIAIARWDDITTLIHESILQSQVTHPHHECTSCCAYINVVLSLLIQGNSPTQAIQQAVRLIELPSELRLLISKAPHKSRDELPNTGWVRHTLESVVWAISRCTDFETTLTQVVNLGGDADTSGTVAGALAGAAYGFEAIPQRWRSQLRGEYPLGSQKIWRTEEFVNLAEALVLSDQIAT